MELERIAVDEPKSYDRALKRLVMEVPQDFVSWLLPGAKFDEELSPHLPKNRRLDTDILLRIIYEEKLYILHIEFETHSRPGMQKRLWEYNVMATYKFDLPVLSIVIYLHKANKLAKPLYKWKWYNKKVIHSFDFRVVKLWEIATDDLLQSGLKGLLPLAPLTREGHREEVVDAVIEGLLLAGEQSYSELFGIAFVLASYVFDKEEEQPRIYRRFSMAGDFLRDTWGYKMIYQEGLQEGVQKGLQEGVQKGLQEGVQKGHQEGLQEGVQKGVQNQKQTLLSFVEVRYPSLLQLAEEQVAKIQDLLLLQKLHLKVTLAKDEQEAGGYLLNLAQLNDK